MKSYRTNVPGELVLNKGDIIESESVDERLVGRGQPPSRSVLSVGEQGSLEGKCHDRQGWFPSHHVQDVCVFSTFRLALVRLRLQCANDSSLAENGELINDDTIVISRDTLSALMINSDAYSPRTIVLQRGKKGFGFVLRGSRGLFDFPSSCEEKRTPLHSSRGEALPTESIVSRPAVSRQYREGQQRGESRSEAERLRSRGASHLRSSAGSSIASLDQRCKRHLHATRRMRQSDQARRRHVSPESDHGQSAVHAFVAFVAAGIDRQSAAEHFPIVTLPTQRCAERQRGFIALLSRCSAASTGTRTTILR